MKCPNCKSELKEKNKKVEIKVTLLDEKDIEFLKESNAIEGEYSEEALEDAKEAFRFAFEHKDTLSVKLVCDIHKILMRRLNPKIAGKIRTKPVYVGNYKEYEECMKSELVKDALHQWCCHSLNPVYLGEEWIKKAHIEFEKIHPFLDGNGRVGRILMNIQRLNLNLPLLIIHEGSEQKEYYKWFKENKK